MPAGIGVKIGVQELGVQVWKFAEEIQKVTHQLGVGAYAKRNWKSKQYTNPARNTFPTRNRQPNSVLTSEKDSEGRCSKSIS